MRALQTAFPGSILILWNFVKDRRLPSRVVNIAVTVKAEWDGEAGVWVATSEDVPGLVAEHRDFGRLEQMVLELVPVLLVENGMLPEDHGAFDVPVHIAAHALSRGSVRIAA